MSVAFSSLKQMADAGKVQLVMYTEHNSNDRKGRAEFHIHDDFIVSRLTLSPASSQFSFLYFSNKHYWTCPHVADVNLGGP